MPILRCELPETALLNRYAALPQNYSDCYTTIIESAVSLADFISAFYNSLGFRPERILLSVVLGRHADNQTVADLAEGRSQEFSAWKVEAREESQIIMQDMNGTTRSWLSVEPVESNLTRLYFGSAVVYRNEQSAKKRSSLFQILIPFHKVYSRVLLDSAASHLRATRQPT